MANERRRLALRLNELEGTTAALRQTASTATSELGRAQSMAADLNKRYEKLLTEKATLNHLKGTSKNAIFAHRRFRIGVTIC